MTRPFKGQIRLREFQQFLVQMTPASIKTSTIDIG